MSVLAMLVEELENSKVRQIGVKDINIFFFIFV